MPRNLYRRVEVAFPIEDPKLKKALAEDLLPAFLKDRVKARELQSDGRYIRLRPKPGSKPSQAQLHFRERARKRSADHAAAGAAVKSKGQQPTLTPIRNHPSVA